GRCDRLLTLHPALAMTKGDPGSRRGVRLSGCEASEACVGCEDRCSPWAIGDIEDDAGLQEASCPGSVRPVEAPLPGVPPPCSPARPRPPTARPQANTGG